MDTPKKDGTRLKIDDPELAPIWDAAGPAEHSGHYPYGEPQEFFKPLDMHNEALARSWPCSRSPALPG